MTEPVKFQGTDIEAPERIWLGNISWDAGDAVVDWTDDYYRACADVKYLRADTVTPNDQVVAMLYEAFNQGAMCHSNSGYTAFIQQQERIVSEIRSRYASSDSD